MGSASVGAPKLLGETNRRIDCRECVACWSKALAIFSQVPAAAVACGGPLRSGYGDGHVLSFSDCGSRSLRVSLLGFTGQADATTRLTLKASPSLTILAQNSENSEVQNLLEPQSDSGVPGGPSQPTPEDQPAAGGNAGPASGRRRRDERDRPGRGQVAQRCYRHGSATDLPLG